MEWWARKICLGPSASSGGGEVGAVGDDIVAGKGRAVGV